MITQLSLVTILVRDQDEALRVTWGVQAVFEDLYGNPFALVQPLGKPGQ